MRLNLTLALAAAAASSAIAAEVPPLPAPIPSEGRAATPEDMYWHFGYSKEYTELLRWEQERVALRGREEVVLHEIGWTLDEHGDPVVTWAGAKALFQGREPELVVLEAGIRIQSAEPGPGDEPGPGGADGGGCQPRPSGGGSVCAGTCPVVPLVVPCANGRTVTVRVNGYCVHHARSEDCQCDYLVHVGVDLTDCTGQALLPTNPGQLRGGHLRRLNPDPRPG